MKKLISILSTVMLLMCGVFVWPDKAEAATTEAEWDEANKTYYGNGNHLNIIRNMGVSDGSYTIYCGEEEEGTSVPADTTIYVGKKNGNVTMESYEAIYVTVQGADIETLYTGGANGGTVDSVCIDLNTNWSDEDFREPVVKNIDMAGTDYVDIWVYGGEFSSISNKAESASVYYYNNTMEESTMMNMGYAESELHLLADIILDPCSGGKLLNIGGEDTGTYTTEPMGFTVEEGYVVRDLLEDWGWSDTEINGVLCPVPNEGMAFAGWYTEKTYGENNKWDVDKKVLVEDDIYLTGVPDETGVRSITLYAKWETLTEEKVEIQSEALDTVEGDLKQTPFNTVDKIEKALLTAIEGKAGYTAENTAFYDVKMRIKVDGKWKDAEETDFPLEGITVTLPYPEGTGKNTHDFIVSHMFTLNSERLNTEAGKMEQPEVIKTDEGIQVTLTGLSPVSVSYQSTGQTGHKMGGENGMLALFLMTAAAAGITGGTLMMRRKAKAAK